MCITDAGCTENISPYLQTLSDTNCHIGPSCQDFLCCSLIATIGRTLRYELSVDACSHTLKISIEDFHYQRSLVNFPFGVTQIFTLSQIFVIE